MIDLTALRDELDNDPTQIGYEAEIGNDAVIASMLNEKRYRGVVPIAELAALCCKTNITGTVMALAEIKIGENIAPGTVMSLQIKALLNTVLTLIHLDTRLESVDMEDGAFAAACDALVSLGVVSEENKTAILDLADNRKSRAELLFGRNVGSSDVSAAFGRI